MICVFDIETIPDIAQIATHYGLQDRSPIEICEYAFKLQKEKTNSEFLPIYWHRVIAISSVICDDYGNFRKVGSFGKKLLESKTPPSEDALERCLLEEFLEFLNSKEVRLVSFNGRGFDLPVVLLRAMRYNLSVFSYYEVHNSTQTKNKWENYRARYSEYWHTDLLDSLGHFGSVRTLNLDGVCKMLGIVGKYDVSGGDVYRLYYEHNALDKINAYCQSDVLNTYWLYLKYTLLKGEISKEDYGAILQDFSDKLGSSAEYAQAFRAKIKDEMILLGHQPMQS